jgi:murein DD-endopeptidase MepM/ murein hydrolase activator NlpD
MFDNLSERLERSFKILKGEGKITEINVAETLKDVRRALLDADVNYKVAKTFTDTVKQKALGQNVLTAVKPSQLMVKIVHDELATLMGGETAELNLQGHPSVILMAGLNGAGKTTLSGKLALMLKTKKRKKKSVQTNAKPAKKQLSFNQEEGLSWPIKGDVLMEYSADKVVYFKTLAQYRTNPALLLETKEGMDVKASADGIVESVETSEETGRTVSISIGDGFTVVYGQLKDVSVSKGDMVSEGQVLGKIAEPTKYYKEEGTNLYFQVKENKTTVNPMLLLK